MIMSNGAHPLTPTNFRGFGIYMNQDQSGNKKLKVEFLNATKVWKAEIDWSEEDVATWTHVAVKLTKVCENTIFYLIVLLQ